MYIIIYSMLQEWQFNGNYLERNLLFISDCQQQTTNDGLIFILIYW